MRRAATWIRPGTAACSSSRTRRGRSCAAKQRVMLARGAGAGAASAAGRGPTPPRRVAVRRGGRPGRVRGAAQLACGARQGAGGAALRHLPRQRAARDRCGACRRRSRSWARSRAWARRSSSAMGAGAGHSARGCGLCQRPISILLSLWRAEATPPAPPPAPATPARASPACRAASPLPRPARR